MMPPLPISIKANYLRPVSNPTKLLGFLLAVGVLFAAIFFGLFSSFLSIKTESGLVLVLAILTLLFFSFFVLGAGIADKKWALGITFFILVLVMEVTFRRREITATGIDAQTLVKLLVWCGAFVIGLANYHYLTAALRASIGLRWILAFGVWATLSTTYSLAPAYTFGGGVAFLSLIVFLPQAIERIGYQNVILSITYACGLITVSALALYFIAPSIAMSEMEGGRILRLAGLTGSPNNLGRIASLGLLFLFFAYRERMIGLMRVDMWAIILACVACLALSWSRTAAAALVVAVVVVLLRSNKKMLYFCVIAGFIMFIALFMADYNWDALARKVTRSGSIEELLTFTGRTVIWEFNWVKFLSEPVLGFGYGATKILLPEEFRTYWGWTTASSHNMMLQALVTTGLIGGILVLGAILWQAIVFFRRPADLPDAIFIYVLLSGAFEAGAVGVSPNMLTLIWVLALVLPRNKQTGIPAGKPI